jgi:predicted XRE-type DNA-binding protein
MRRVNVKRSSRKSKTPGTVLVHESSGNVFEDLGVSESTEAFAKAELVARIAELVSERGLTQVEAAKVFGIDQPSVSDLLRGRFRGFSSDRLFRFLNALGRDVEIVIRPRGRSSSKPKIRVVRGRMAG